MLLSSGRADNVAMEGFRLVVTTPEAEQVRAILALYQAERSLIKVANELNRRGWRRKSWTTREGRVRVGKTWDKTNLHKLLVNPLYAGLQRLGDDTFPGEHPAIVPIPTFRKVQSLLAANRCAGPRNRNEGGALLRGILRCTACDAPMIHSWTRKAGRAYRYYVCTHAQKNGAASCPTRSIRADAIEQVVVDRIRGIGTDRTLQRAVLAEAGRQTNADRDALTAERKRLEADTRAAKTEIAGLAASIARTDGLAADALVAALGGAQQRLNELTGRVAEVEAQLLEVDHRELDEDDLRRALGSFDPIWEALLIPERVRIVQLLIERVGYDGRTEDLEIAFRPAGFVSLAGETQGEEA